MYYDVKLGIITGRLHIPQDGQTSDGRWRL